MIRNTIIISIVGSLLLSGCSSKIQNNITKVPASKSINKANQSSFYEEQRKKELAKIITQKNLPIKTQDKVLRVLIMPYVDNNNVLQTQNFHYTTVEKGKWILGEYLLDDGKNSVKELTPLKSRK